MTYTEAFEKAMESLNWDTPIEEGVNLILEITNKKYSAACELMKEVVAECSRNFRNAFDEALKTTNDVNPRTFTDLRLKCSTAEKVESAIWKLEGELKK